MCPRWLLFYSCDELPVAGSSRLLDNVKELFGALDFFVSGCRGVR